ncbi:hypothetical protein MHN80_11540 [Gordonia McavH-238-E]|uniref:hypothetical protein n=1 Tax=Gordonia sp. McavH-238-E TaxID=2917736 RepID=UPI001EF3DD9C|nr:hypothetical protein [Gordonia sp. McavH-238-E]MCG7632944.1 hypothetical protein [Gordonia sp. McavH-238-E]
MTINNARRELLQDRVRWVVATTIAYNAAIASRESITARKADACGKPGTAQRAGGTGECRCRKLSDPR